MSKKDFSGGLSSLLGETKQEPTKKRGRPKTSTRQITKSSQEGTKENETRATFIVREDTLDKIKAVAYWERVQIKEVLNTALQEYLASYEAKNGKIKQVIKK